MSVHELGAHLLGRYIFNCWVVPDGGAGAPLVVDLGVPQTARDLRRFVSDTGATTPVVAATHCHVDHVAGIPTFREHDHCPVCLPPMAERYAAGEPFELPGLRDVVKAMPVWRSQPFSFAPFRELARAEVGTVRAGYRSPCDDPTYLVDGEPVPGAPDWVVMALPGHSEDSVGLWNERTRTLCSGDAILAVGPRAWFNPETVLPERQAETEDRLRSMRVEVLLPGHGRPVVGYDVLAEAFGFRDRPPRGLHRR